MDRNTGQGISNLRVEAWDVRKDNQGSFGSANVDANGHFILCLDLKNLELRRPPDLYFKIYRSAQLLADTEDTVVLKGGEDREVLIQLTIPVAYPEGKDRVNAKQLFTGVDFIQQSDFKGLFTDVKGKAGTRVSFISDMVMNTFNKADIKPIKVTGTRESDVINQPVAGVKEKLEAKKVVVENVLPYDPQINRASFNNITSLPANLKEGEKVNLYEENGKVRYYSIVKQNISTAGLTAIADEHTEQLTKLQNELNVTKENAAQKDAEIIAHRDQLSKMQEELNLAKETAAKKDAGMLEVTRTHNDQLVKMQEQLNAAKDSAAQKDAEFSKLNAALTSMRTDQSNMLTMLKPENLVKLLKGDVLIKGRGIQVPKTQKTKAAVAKKTPPK